MIQKLKSTLLYGGLTKEDFQVVSDAVRSSNQMSVIVFSVVCALAFILAMILSLFNAPMASNRVAYLTAIIVMLFTIALSIVEKSSRTMNICVYLFMISLYAAGIYISAVNGIGEQATSFVALLLAIPLLFVTRPVFSNLLIVFADIAFVLVLRTMNQEPELLGKNTVNAIVYGFVSVTLSTTMMRIKYERIHMEIKNKYLSETDQLSGLLNRRAYVEMCEQAKTSGKTGVIFCDLNSLKYTNDNFGHEAGDKLITNFSELLLDCFHREYAFRISGDEFVVVLPNHDAEEVNGMVEELYKALEEGEYPLAAVGCAYGKGSKIVELISEAEDRMYKEKAQFYIDFPIYARKNQ